MRSAVQLNSKAARMRVFLQLFRSVILLSSSCSEPLATGIDNFESFNEFSRISIDGLQKSTSCGKHTTTPLYSNPDQLLRNSCEEGSSEVANDLRIVVSMSRDCCCFGVVRLSMELHDCSMF